MYRKMVKSPLKWVGGKHKLLDTIFKNFPKDINNYYEPFLGGGSILFNLLMKIDKGNIKANVIKVNDINVSLIRFYDDIKCRPIKLIDEIDKIIKEYTSVEIMKHPARKEVY